MIIVSGNIGDLGNHLILGAHLIAFSKEFGWRLSNLGFYNFAPFFEGPSRSPYCLFPPPRSRGRFLPSTRAFRIANITGRIVRRLRLNNRLVRGFRFPDQPRVNLAQPEWRIQIEGSAMVFLGGWGVRNYELVKKHQEEIRAYFRPVAAVRSRLDSFFQTFRADGRPLVGIHIRQGDYKDYLGGRYYFSSALYAAYMRRINVLLGGQATFLVCSNNAQSAETFAGMDVHFGPGHLVEDLYALANCEYILGVPSTFSGWSAFYGRKKLCVLDNHPGPESLTLDDFKVQGDRI
jgi:hypothetical protein